MRLSTFVLVSTLGLLTVGLAVALFVNGRDTEHTLTQTRSALTATNSKLATTQQSLTARTRERDNARSNATSLQREVESLQEQLSASQNQLHSSEQVTSQIAEVATSLKSCVDANARFSADFLGELRTGFFSAAVSDEANAADSACAQANSDYSTLVSILRLAGAGPAE